MDFVRSTGWHDLDPKILNYIIKPLNTSNKIRCSLVCKHWRSTITMNHPNQQQHLWLLLPHEFSNQHLSFFDIIEGATHKFKLPDQDQGGWRPWTSSKSSGSWLALENTNTHQILLFNPISHQQIQLPCFPKDQVINQITHVHIRVTSDSKLVAVVIDHLTLALCEPEKEWKFYELLRYREIYSTILFSNDGNFLYCLIVNHDYRTASQTHPVRLTDGDEPEVTLNLIPKPEPDQNDETPYDGDDMVILRSVRPSFSTLVESGNGELLVIHTIIDYWLNKNFRYPDEEDGVLMELYSLPRVQGFEVGWLQLTDHPFPDQIRIDDLGDLTLFVCGNGAFVAPPELNGLVKSNCIYFLDQSNYNWKKMHLISRESGIFRMDQGSILRCFPSVDFLKKQMCGMAWFLPTIKIGD